MIGPLARCRIRAHGGVAGWSVERVYPDGAARVQLPHCRHFETAIKIAELLDVDLHGARALALASPRGWRSWPGRWHAWRRLQK